MAVSQMENISKITHSLNTDSTLRPIPTDPEVYFINCGSPSVLISDQEVDFINCGSPNVSITDTFGKEKILERASKQTRIRKSRDDIFTIIDKTFHIGFVVIFILLILATAMVLIIYYVINH